MSVDSSVPLEEQVREQIREAIARGEVVAGDPLPSVRQLAGDLGGAIQKVGPGKESRRYFNAYRR